MPPLLPNWPTIPITQFRTFDNFTGRVLRSACTTPFTRWCRQRVRQVALLGVTGTMDDPERLRNLRQGLLRADAEVSAFFASARDLVCELDANGVFVRLNPRWQDQLGYALEEMQSRPWTEFVHPDDLVATRDALDKLKREDSVQFENRLRHSSHSV